MYRPRIPLAAPRFRPLSRQTVAHKSKMADDRYNRWQAAATGQLTVAVALISGLSVAALGAGLSLLKEKDFAIQAPYGWLFAGAMGLLFLAAISSTLAVLSRLLDFRLTARKVRKDKFPAYDKSLRMFRLNADEFGEMTWRLLWMAVLAFSVGSALLVISVGSMYAGKLL